MELMIPRPMPDTTRPKISWVRLYAAAWRSAPAIMATQPFRIVRRRPRASPQMAANMEPRRQPTKG